MPNPNASNMVNSGISQDPNNSLNTKMKGYKFAEDNMANKMAYLFGGEKGEARAKKIREEADAQFTLLQMPEKKKFIEKQVQDWADEVDNNFHKGLQNVFNRLSSKTTACKGEDAEKEAVCDLMEGLGLNIDRDNVQTNYDPGPPKVMQISWVNRPTENLSNKDSEVNKLSDSYQNSLSFDKQKQNDFNSSWDGHKANALNGGPKMDKKQFEKEADQSFNGTLCNIKASTPNASPPPVDPEGGVEMDQFPKFH